MQNSKKIELMILRITATLGVVFLHTCNTLTTNENTFISSTGQYEFFAIGTTLMMWAVPCFLMISGELLLNNKKTISIKVAINKYVKRVALALFIFGIPFSMMEIISKEKTLNLSTIVNSLVNVVNGESWSHLWYLYALIGIYLLLPFLKMITDKANCVELRCLIIVIFVFNCVFPFIDIFADTTINFKIPITGYTILYILLGKYISDNIDFKKIKLSKTLVSLVMLSIMQVLLCIYGGKQFLEYVGYSSPINVALSINVYTIFKILFNRKEFNENTKERIWKIDRLCFGVYLIHPLFINLTYKFLHIYPTKFNIYWLLVFVFWIMFVTCSYVGSMILSLIPFLKKNVL